MPLLSPETMNASLDGDYGSTRGPHAADSHELVLFYDDPSLAAAPEDVEISGGGYARVTILPADWAAASAGFKSPTAPVQLPTVTAEWPDAALYFGLYGDDGLWWDFGPLTAPLEVTGVGPGPLVTPTVFYDDAVSTTEG